MPNDGMVGSPGIVSGRHTLIHVQKTLQDQQRSSDISSGLSIIKHPVPLHSEAAERKEEIQIQDSDSAELIHITFIQSVCPAAERLPLILHMFSANVQKTHRCGLYRCMVVLLDG